MNISCVIQELKRLIPHPRSPYQAPRIIDQSDDTRNLEASAPDSFDDHSPTVVADNDTKSNEIQLAIVIDEA
jgi:hypothetical protein